MIGGYAYGADCSWITEQEADGVLFYDSLGQATDGMQVMREAGMNAVRLRVWVNHSTGWCNKEDVIIKAKRAAALKLRVMIDFHYSDFFADPSRQDIPVDWVDYDLAQMKQAVANHTTEVLSALKAEGVTPEWIQVGNETRNGMLWPMGQLWNSNGDLPNGWKNYAALTTAGYDACKAIFPEASVIVHIDNAYENNNWFFRKLKQNGGKFDMIGLSHYPMMKQWSGKDWDEMNELAAANIRLLHNEFKCPVMVVEIGTMASSVSKAAEVIADFRQRVDTLDYMKGIFYWEPQV
jgi:arabinogalactan endo-1,4-beta-galactosidase